jgi:hypothetical protein
MRPHIAVSLPRRQNPRTDIARDARIAWGLSSRLPRWRSFDGRRSRVAPTWATINGRKIVEAVTAITLALAVAAAITICRRDDLHAVDAHQIGLVKWAAR